MSSRSLNEAVASQSTTPPWFLFDNSADPVHGGALLFENPTKIIRADQLADVPVAIDQLQRAIDGGHHAAGFFSYELGYALEPSLQPLMPQARQVPLIWFAIFPSMEALKGKAVTTFLRRRARGLPPGALKEITPALSKEDYLKRFARVKELIASGDIYQVNLAFKLLFQYEGSPFSLYSALRQRQPVSYGAYLQTPDFSILSFSPELFFEARDGLITTRPMKGTIRRGASSKEDDQLVRTLHEDIKNRAENLMIVDLMRNDFSRICDIGSVDVSDLYRVERYPTLSQMTSGVQGRLHPDADLEAIIRALVPAGSITGAPKIRAQEIIRELEDEPRGLYCGAMGVLSRDQQTGQLSALFNVAIRTLTLLPDGHGETGIGSGVVQDSQGEDEYDECLLKAKYLTMPDFTLIETMRLDPDGSYYLLERHLARLMRSSQSLSFLCPLDRCRKELEALSKSLERGCYRVRMLLGCAGDIELSSTSINPPDESQAIRFVVSKERVSSADLLLAHKTTRRELFDDEWARAHHECEADEVLFCNERGELTEGSRSTLFIEREGVLLTPPLACGVLPGTLREQLMEEGRVIERVLSRQDLKNSKVYFGNSVRGLQPARLIED